MITHTILIVEDEAAQRDALSGFLKKKGFDVKAASSGMEALEIIQAHAVDLILTDLKMPGMDGLELLTQVREINPDTGVIVMTAFGSIEGATQAMKNGALDYLTKPIDLDQLEVTVAKALEHKQLVSENRALRAQLAERFRFDGIISASSTMEEALNIAGRAAASKATVLICGESGTGKELVARAIHLSSPRKDKPFVAVNVAALAENLLESELFGHEKGAFTGADRQRKGRFELADGGTLFIDEIGEIPPTTQVKLLRVLQERVFERVGGTEQIQIDVRVITATNTHLEDMVKDGTFRKDLFYRLNVVRVQIPPLRKRKTDIPILIDHFLKKYSEENQKQLVSISKEAMDLLMKYDYPGNVRELENIIEQAVVLCRSDIITINDLPASIRGLSSDKSMIEVPVTGSFQERVEAFEQRLILDALESANGVQTRAANLLGMSERHLRYKLKKYGLKD